MRWHVHGTDATTGTDVVLALDGEEATHAVQTAIAKRILVSHVTDAAGESIRRLLLPVTLAVLTALIPVCAGLVIQNMSTRAKLAQAVREQTRLAQSVAAAETIASQIRQATPPATADDAAAAIKQMGEQLAGLRAQMNGSQEQLQSARQQIAGLQRTARDNLQLQQQIASAGESLHASEMTVTKLLQELALQRRRLEEIEKVPVVAVAPAPSPAVNPLVEKVRGLENANRDLAAELDVIKSQLLIAVAKAHMPVAAAAADPEPAPAGPAVQRWALRANYEAASGFLGLHFDKETLGITPTPDDSVIATGSRPANAAAMRFVYDRARERVYSGTLTVSLAADAPREKLAENLALAATFVKTFAPSFQTPEGVINNAVGQLANKDETQRVVLVGADYRLMIWNNQQGLFTLRIEPPRADADE